VWIDQLNKYIRLKNIKNESEKIKVLFTVLSDDQKAMVQQATSMKPNQQQFQLMLEYLKELYQTNKKDNTTEMYTFLQRKQRDEEDLLSFYLDLIRLGKLAFTNADPKYLDARLAQQFTNGINCDQTRNRLQWDMPPEADYSAYLIAAKKIYKPPQPMIKVEIACLAATETTQKSNLKPASDYQKETKRISFAESDKYRRCQNCGETGHGWKTCYKPKTCFNCRKPGHYSRECPLPNRRQTNQQDQTNSLTPNSSSPPTVNPESVTVNGIVYQNNRPTQQ
jgi:hypothetical protein